MRKTIEGIWSKAVLLCSMLVCGVGAYAQDGAAAPLPESAYQYEAPKHMGGIMNGQLPVIIFGVLFVVMIITAYHYWANGRLVDDMSDDSVTHHQS
jgi:hypothetical protein